MINFKEIFNELKYVILFYVILDFITTAIVLHYDFGYEGNVFLRPLIESYGIWILLAIKISYIIIISIFYLFFKIVWNHNILGFKASNYWHSTKFVVILFGIIIVLNNLIVIIKGLSYL